jgi:hypothetical protein
VQAVLGPAVMLSSPSHRLHFLASRNVFCRESIIHVYVSKLRNVNDCDASSSPQLECERRVSWLHVRMHTDMRLCRQERHELVMVSARDCD